MVAQISCYQNSDVVLYFGDNGQRLSCHGIKSDKIDGLGEIDPEYGENRKLTYGIVQPRASENIYGSLDAFREALWRTLTGNRDLQGKKITSEYQWLLQCAPQEEQESASVTRGARALSRFIMESAVGWGGCDGYRAKSGGFRETRGGER